MSKFKKWMKASLLISGISILLLLIVTVNSETIETVLKIKYEYIVLAVIMHIVAYFMWALRTKSMCQGIDYKIKFLSCVKIVTAGKFAASITPSSIGGEPLRIELLHQNELPIGRASAIVLGERFMDAFLILFSAPVALYILRDGFSDSSLDIVFIMGEFILMSVLLIMLYGLLRPENLKRIIRFIAIKLTKLLGKKREDQIYHVLKKIDSEFYNFHASLRMLLREGRTSLVCGMLFTVFYWLFLFSILPVILMGLNLNPPVIITFAAQILLLIITAVPITPGASGVAELGATTLFSVFVVSSLIGITVVTWRVLTYYMNLLVGGFVSIKIAKDTELINRLFG